MNPSMFTELRFATPAIEVFANTLRQWFEAAVIGGLIYGPSRAGKSYAIEYVISRKEEIFGYEIPIISLEWKKALQSEKDFHERFLNACGHSVPSDRTPNRKLESRLVEYISSAVSLSESSNVVLFIDEAQDLRLDDLGFLANIYNQLKKKKIQQFTFLVGERKLLELRGKSEGAGYHRYIGRFMCADFEFPLLASESDLSFVLKQYDSSDYPEGSGVTIVQQILPKAVDNGWLFEDQANLIWTGFRSAVRSIGKKSPRMTMQSCTILIAQLLQSLSKRDRKNLCMTQKDVDNATKLIKHLHNT